MLRYLLLVAPLVAALGLLPASAEPQIQIGSYKDARAVFWEDLFPGGFEELYCGVSVSAREDHNIEHIFPAFWMTKTQNCGSRRTCRRNSPAFNRMEADLHNLLPTRTSVNAARGSFPFGEVPGEDHDFAGCDFEENSGIVEPRPAARGQIARAILHMTEAYGAENILPDGQLSLMRQWDRYDPPTALEHARNDRIEELQGTRNSFIDAHDRNINNNGLAINGDGAAVTGIDGTRVRVASWNIANLHWKEGEHLPGRPSAPAREASDYKRIANYISAIDADVFTLQEVNGPDAVAKVFPPSQYHIIVSQRFEDDRDQERDTDHIYTAVAVKKSGSVSFIAGQTYNALSIIHDPDGDARPTRAGTEVLLELPNGEPLQVMSVHLKSSCHAGSLDNPRNEDCVTLANQRAPLEAWIDELTEDNTPFIIAGDWNRRIDRFAQNDHLWGEIDDNSPAPLDLARFPEGITSPCLAGTSGHFPDPIDFIVLDEQALRWADRDSFQIVDFKPNDRPHRKKISDHCALYIDLVIPQP
ncbi:endonuclease [Roseibium sp. RKSG952]|uniref:endonuclease n=1 Tax=Roseibium sp. RKSG952 TaxID=2529384 RepID=UPI0018AD179B|nr:endonuclease [Roseibium sp. RKSG952]